MRFLHRLLAMIGGFFWLPCPVCGRMFGGHELTRVDTASVVIADGTRRVVCTNPMCSHAAAVINIRNGHDEYVRLRPNAGIEPPHDAA